jgi:hypothetical protein
MTEKHKGILIKCPKPECEYSWWYSGRLVVYATCPSCRRNIKVSENKIETLPSQRGYQPTVYHGDSTCGSPVPVAGTPLTEGRH